jgi:hypothetical protein
MDKPYNMPRFSNEYWLIHLYIYWWIFIITEKRNSLNNYFIFWGFRDLRNFLRFSCYYTFNNADRTFWTIIKSRENEMLVSFCLCLIVLILVYGNILKTMILKYKIYGWNSTLPAHSPISAKRPDPIGLGPSITNLVIKTGGRTWFGPQGPKTFFH